MNSLKKLNEKIKSELRLREYDDDDDDDISIEDEEFENNELEDGEVTSSASRIRIETESRIKGLIKNLEFDVEFRDLADRVNDEIDGVVLTRDKAHQLFNLFRDIMGF